MEQEPVTERARVAIAGLSPIECQAIHDAINQQADMQCVGYTTRTENIPETLQKMNPQLVILVQSYEKTDIFKYIKDVRAKLGTTILVLDEETDPSMVQRYLRLGAKGFANTREPPETTITACRELLQGKYALPNTVINYLATRMLALEASEAREEAVKQSLS